MSSSTLARLAVTTEMHTKAMLVYKSEKRAYLAQLAQLAPTRGKKMAALQHPIAL